MVLHLKILLNAKVCTSSLSLFTNALVPGAGEMARLTGQGSNRMCQSMLIAVAIMTMFQFITVFAGCVVTSSAIQ